MDLDPIVIKETQAHLAATMQECVGRLRHAERECASLTYQLHLTKQLQKQADKIIERDMWELEEAILSCRIEAASNDIDAIEDELLRTRRLQEIVIQHVDMLKKGAFAGVENALSKNYTG